MATRSRLFVVIAALVLGGVLTGCKTRSTRRSPDLVSQRQRGSIAIDGATLESIARRNTYPRARAETYLDAARAYLDQDRPTDAMRCAHEARQSQSSKLLVTRSYRLLGQSHLATGQYQLAERYLRKGLDDAAGAEREEASARLVVTLRALGRAREAAQLESTLRNSQNRVVRELLAKKAPTPRKKRGTRLSTGRPVAPRQPMPSEADRFRLPRIQVLARNHWRARAVVRGRTSPIGSVRKVTIHHSAPPYNFEETTRGAAADEIRRIQRYHQKQRGWADIGYHYIIDRRGEVWQGRPLSYQGAHASGAANRGNVGIVVLGNYSARRQRLNQAQRQSLSVLTAKLCDHFRIPAREVYTHEEIRPGHTSCPGPDISQFVGQLRTSLHKRQVALAAIKSRVQTASLQGK